MALGAAVKGPCTTAHGPRLKGCQTGCPDHHPVCCLVLLQQAVADQQLDPTLAELDRCTGWTDGMLASNPKGCALLRKACQMDLYIWIMRRHDLIFVRRAVSSHP